MNASDASVPARLAAHAIGMILLALLTAGPAQAADGFSAAALDAGAHRLVITRSDGTHFDAPALPDQVGFASPRVSRDGRYVGWLALYDNCCTSYPIPLRLIVLGPPGQMHTFEGAQLAMFDWCFLPDAKTVAYVQTLVHGSDYEYFERRTIADGHLVARYEYPDAATDNARARARAPAWVRRVPDPLGPATP